MKERTYLCIDLKSFYASVECIDRGLNPLTTHLVVADPARTEKTICLAVSPALKKYGFPGRLRLFEALQLVEKINKERQTRMAGIQFAGESSDELQLKTHPELSLCFLTAPPRMARYMSVSTKIYSIYLKYVAPEDIHVYSIDEVFIDITHYLGSIELEPRAFAKQIIQDVYSQTGITAAAGMGSNMYLAKVAMDIEAKHTAPDRDGIRIAQLDEMSYRRKLWSHRPLTDFWRVGHGYAKKLEKYGIMTMGDVARCSLGQPSDFYNEDLLYKLFGVNAELLIDHAWGWEPCTIADIKAYRPESSSTGAGQVLPAPYEFEKARLIVREMTDQLVLELVDKGLVTDQIVLTVGYDRENLSDPQRKMQYTGEVTADLYGRRIPKHAHGTAKLGKKTASTKLITNAMVQLYDRIVDPNLLIRRLNVTAVHVISVTSDQQSAQHEQLDLFEALTAAEQSVERSAEEREKRIQLAVLGIRKRYGKNAILKGMSLQDGATAKDRNSQIGGHKA